MVNFTRALFLNIERHRKILYVAFGYIFVREDKEMGRMQLSFHFTIPYDNKKVRANSYYSTKYLDTAAFELAILSTIAVRRMFWSSMECE
jgi:hypothetical protein